MNNLDSEEAEKEHDQNEERLGSEKKGIAVNENEGWRICDSCVLF